ncbi:MAG: ATP phosphoribosyltransferase [Patescibacteria group bacterium]
MFEFLAGFALAVPDGSMEAVVINWLKKAGIAILFSNGRVKTGTTNVPFIQSLTLLRPQEIPIYLEKGCFQVAIANEDWIANWQSDVVILARFPIARATNQAVRIVLAVSKASGYEAIGDLPKGSTIATEYVELTGQYLAQKGRADIEVIRSWGGTEQKIKFGAAAIVELTETGSSLISNGLKIIDEIMISNTVIAVNREAYNNIDLRPQIDWFVEVMKGANLADSYVFVQANVSEGAVKKASEILGGMYAPTISSLTTSGWYSISAYVLKNCQHEIVFQLLQMEVKDICVHDNISMVLGR